MKKRELLLTLTLVGLVSSLCLNVMKAAGRRLSGEKKQ